LALPKDDELVRFRREMRDRMEQAYNSRYRAGSLSPSATDAGIDWASVQDAVATARSSYALVGQMPPQPPTLRGRTGAALVRVMRRLLFWYTPQVIRFHYAAVEALEAQARAIVHLGNKVTELERLLGEHAQPRNRDSDRRAGRLAQDPDALYLALENRFRGSREEVKDRLRVYLPRILGAGDGPLLDIGCGRGEWLELLREEGHEALGVDSNSAMIALCRERALEASQADALEFLRGRPDDSFGAITAFHLIEHLLLSELVELLDEILRVLKPGGVAIFETPNPNNILTASHYFYLDPTHRHPIPPLLGKFLVEACGFRNVESVELNPWPESVRMDVDETGEIAKRWNDVFFGPQDYAIIGFKA
jgi:ubiquinone/menaquinone biosynthesis C-methylase UbiE